MTQNRRQHLAFLGAAAVLPLVPAKARAETVHEVQMLNHHPEDDKKLMVFYPEILQAQPGDIIRFVSADKNHNSEAYKTMLPDGAEHWKSKIGKDFDLPVEAEGTYGYFCTPHKSWGMVGLLLVGDASTNYEAVKTVRKRGKAKTRFEELFAEADKILAGEA
ncbi:MAG: pseudoazurin [Pseudomonadota bacterium]